MKNGPVKKLWMVLAVACVLRMGFGIWVGPAGASADEYHWDRLGQGFLTLGVFHPDTGMYRPPLYGLMIAGIYGVVGPLPEAVRLVQALLGAATCGLLFVLGQRVGGVRVGLMAAGIGAVYPLFVFFSGLLLAETLLVFLTVASLVLAVVFWEAPTGKRAAALGVVVGLSALCKPVLLPWLPVVLWLWWRSVSMSVRQKAVYAGGVVGAMVLTVLPWTLRNYAVSGHWVPIASNTGINLLIGALPESGGVYNNEIDYLGRYRALTGTLDGAVGDRAVVRAVLGWIAEDPAGFVGLAFLKLVRFWSPLVLGESVGRNLVALLSSGPLLVLGIVGAVRLQHRPAGALICALVVTLSVLHMVFFAHTRFRLPVDAAFCVSAAWLVERYLQTRQG